jgi:predicted transcriptional regulator
MGELPNIKAQVRQLLETLPDDCTFEDIQYHLYVLDKVARGQRDLDKGRVISHDEVKRRLAKWLTA